MRHQEEPLIIQASGSSAFTEVTKQQKGPRRRILGPYWKRR